MLQDNGDSVIGWRHRGDIGKRGVAKYGKGRQR